MSLEELHSPFSHLLSTNYVPNSTETHRIHNLLSRPLSELSRLDTEIDKLQAAIHDLCEQRDKARNFVDAHRALLSPARRLPPEILAEIFVHCLPTTHNPVKSTTEAPLLLGHICSAWRNISLSTPRLWSSMHLVVPTHFDASKSTPIIQLRCDALKEWLGRSGTLPLSISLATPSDGSSADLSATPLIECLVQFSHRWRNIGLRVPYDLLKPFDALTKDDIPCLEVIKIDHTFNWDPSRRCYFPSMMAAPRLHRVSFSHFQGDPHELPVPWGRLTELILEAEHGLSCLTSNEALTMLKQCPNLQSCTLSVRSPDPGGFTPPSELVQLLALHTFGLHIYPDTSGDLPAVFDHLFTPSLVKLAVTVVVPMSFSLPPHISFRSLLTHSSCQLEILDLDRVPISSEAFIECLHLVPTLTTLSVAEDASEWPPWPNPIGAALTPMINDEVFRLLTPTNAGSPECLVPHLKSVRLLECTAISDEVLIDFLQSRWQQSPAIDMEAGEKRSARGSQCPSGFGVARLSSVIVWFNRFKVADILPQVQVMREQGLDIVVTYLPPPPSMDYSDSPWEGLPLSYSTV